MAALTLLDLLPSQREAADNSTWGCAGTGFHGGPRLEGGGLGGTCYSSPLIVGDMGASKALLQGKKGEWKSSITLLQCQSFVTMMATSASLVAPGPS